MHTKGFVIQRRNSGNRLTTDKMNQANYRMQKEFNQQVRFYTYEG
jgi:hypothetical protein